MDDAAIVEYEIERQKWNLDPEASATATGKKSGCGKLLLMFVLGILIVRILGEFLMIIFSK